MRFIMLLVSVLDGFRRFGGCADKGIVVNQECTEFPDPWRPPFSLRGNVTGLIVNGLVVSSTAGNSTVLEDE